MALPDGLDEIIAEYGNPFAAAGDPSYWEKSSIVLTSLPPGLFVWLGRPMGAMRVNRKIQGQLRGALIEMARAKLQGIAFTRAYEWSVVGDQLSVHTWGIALDVEHPDAEKNEQVAGWLVGVGGFVRNGNHYQLATGYEVE